MNSKGVASFLEIIIKLMPKKPFSTEIFFISILKYAKLKRKSVRNE
jgi:hypothetical protein